MSHRMTRRVQNIEAPISEVVVRFETTNLGIGFTEVDFYEFSIFEIGLENMTIWVRRVAREERVLKPFSDDNLRTARKC